VIWLGGKKGNRPVKNLFHLSQGSLPEQVQEEGVSKPRFTWKVTVKTDVGTQVIQMQQIQVNST